MFSKRYVTVLSVVLMGSFVFMGCAEKYKPAFSPQVGDKRLMDIKIEFRALADASGRDILMNKKGTYQIFVEVAEVSDTGAVMLEGVLEDLEMYPDETDLLKLKEYSKGALDAGHVEDIIQTTIGKRFTFQLDPDGTIESIPEFKNLPETLTRESNIKSTEAAAVMQKMLKTILGEESIISALEDVFHYGPDTPVAIGGSWVERSDTHERMRQDTKETITLVSCDNDQARMERTAEYIFTKTGDGAIPNRGMTVVDVEGVGTGTEIVSMTSGWPVTMEYSSDTKTTIQYKENNGSLGTMVQKSKSRFTATFTVK